MFIYLRINCFFMVHFVGAVHLNKTSSDVILKKKAEYKIKNSRNLIQDTLLLHCQVPLRQHGGS